MSDKNTYNSLLEYKLRNKFYKKEVFLIGIMIISLMVLIFTLTKWSNLISLIFIIVALFLVHLKLFSLFSYREKKYSSLIKKVKSDFKSIIAEDFEDIKDVKVTDHIEIIPVTESDKYGTIRYSLDDYLEYEMSKSSDEEIQLIFDLPKITSDWIDPINSPISELLRERASERRRKMKDLNYQFEKSISTIKQKNYSEYIEYIENKFRKKDIKDFEYKILLKSLLTYLETENSEIIENASSDFKEKIKTLISDLQDADN